MFSLTIAPLFDKTPPSRLPLHSSVFLVQIEARSIEKKDEPPLFIGSG